MGLSSLTRYSLFRESGDFIGSSDEIIQFMDSNAVRNMYHDSARLIRGFEDIINNGDDIHQPNAYQSLFEHNAANIQNKLFVQRVTDLIKKQMVKKEKEQLSTLSFTTFFRYLIKAIAYYQEEIIADTFITPTVVDEMDEIHTARKQTFLSYAYKDKGLTLALFYYFWIRSGFLFVDWMWNGTNSHSSTIKSELERALTNSEQLLLLRTANSELRVQGSNNIRQWCAWEIGNFYTKHKGEKYYTSFYDKTKPGNDILDTFKPMKEVVMGEIKS